MENYRIHAMPAIANLPSGRKVIGVIPPQPPERLLDLQAEYASQVSQRNIKYHKICGGGHEDIWYTVTVIEDKGERYFFCNCKSWSVCKHIKRCKMLFYRAGVAERQTLST